MYFLFIKIHSEGLKKTFTDKNRNNDNQSSKPNSNENKSNNSKFNNGKEEDFLINRNNKKDEFSDLFNKTFAKDANQSDQARINRLLKYKNSIAGSLCYLILLINRK